MDFPDILELALAKLREGLIGISPTGAAALIEACCVALHNQQHSDKVSITVAGAFSLVYCIRWYPGEVTDQVRRFWNDPDRAAEWGAECIACLLIIELTEYTIIDRSRKGTGFDYWLGHDDDGSLFERKGRLEVSGMTSAKESEIKSRTKQKITQTEKSDCMALPAYAVVVEFSRPRAQVATK